MIRSYKKAKNKKGLTDRKKKLRNLKIEMVTSIVVAVISLVWLLPGCIHSVVNPEKTVFIGAYVGSPVKKNYVFENETEKIQLISPLFTFENFSAELEKGKMYRVEYLANNKIIIEIEYYNND